MQVRKLSLVLVYALLVGEAGATGEMTDLWKNKDIVPESHRENLPDVAKATGLIRVWVNLNTFSFSDRAQKAIISAKPTSVYRVRLSKRKIFLGQRSDPKWQLYEVQRYGRLLAAFEVGRDGTAEKKPSLLGFDDSGKQAAALDSFYQSLQAEETDKARRAGRELLTHFRSDPELWFHLAALETKGEDPIEEVLKGVATAGALRAAVETRQRASAHPKFKGNNLEFLSALSYSTELVRLIEKCSEVGAAVRPKSADRENTMAAEKPDASSAEPLLQGLPAKAKDLAGGNEVRVRNPNPMSVAAGLRTGAGGKDITVPAFGVASVRVPDGKYDIYFVYADKPDALFQGDSFALKRNGVEIHLVQVVGGNYGIRRVK